MTNRFDLAQLTLAQDNRQQNGKSSNNLKSNHARDINSVREQLMSVVKEISQAKKK
jgi:hypothetical protein